MPDEIDYFQQAGTHTFFQAHTALYSRLRDAVEGLMRVYTDPRSSRGDFERAQRDVDSACSEIQTLFRAWNNMRFYMEAQDQGDDDDA